MRFFWPMALLTVLSFSACAPAQRGGAASAWPPARSDFHAVFSQQGVTWVSRGRACVARAPLYAVLCPRLGTGAVDVAWHGGDAWAALPQVGLVVTLDRAAQSVNVGAAALLTSQLIYREDGSALTYTAALYGQVAGQPSRAVTGGDGADYVILAGQLRRVADNAVIDPAPRPELASTPTGVESVLVPTLVTETGSYRVNAGMLERLDTAGQVLERVLHAAAQVGLVNDDVVTVTPEGHIRRFSASLHELP